MKGLFLGKDIKSTKGRKSKFSNVKTNVDGVIFDSIKEAKHYSWLKYRQMAKEISDLKLQPEFPVHINGTLVFKYVADFSYTEKGKKIIVDAKGFKTPTYRLKKKCVEAFYGIEITEV